MYSFIHYFKSWIADPAFKICSDPVFKIWQDVSPLWTSISKMPLKSNLLAVFIDKITVLICELFWLLCRKKKLKGEFYSSENWVGSVAGLFLRVGSESGPGFSRRSDSDLDFFSKVGSGIGSGYGPPRSAALYKRLDIRFLPNF